MNEGVPVKLEEPGSVLKKLSVHVKVALACVPVLVLLIVASSLLFANNEPALDKYSEFAPLYLTQVSKLLIAVKDERQYSQLAMLYGRKGVAIALDASDKATDAAIVDLRAYHYRHSVQEDPTGVQQLGVFSAVVRQAELYRVRNDRLRADLSHHDIAAALGYYDKLIWNLIVLGGRQQAHVLNEFSRTNLALFGAILKMSAISATEMSSAWVTSQSSAPSQGSLHAALEAQGRLRKAEAVFYTYTDMDSLKQAEQFEEEDVLQSLKVVLNSVSRLGSKTLHGGADPAQPVSCADFVDDVLSNTSFLHEELELGVLDRRDLLQTRSDLLLAIIIVSGCAIGIHAINVLSYRNTLHHVQAARKEVLKLKKSLTRMHDYIRTIEEATEQPKHKGAPPAEKALYSTFSNMKQMRGYLPQALFSDRFKSFSEGPAYTQLELQLVNDVTILVCDMGQLNLSSPQEEVPVKQKALETALNIYLSAVHQVAEENQGSIVDIISDNITIAWNLIDRRGRSEVPACKAALDIIERAKGEGASKPTIGIVTDTVLAGNVGIPTLKTFQILGPCLPMCRHLEKLARLYSFPIILDTTTAEGVACADFTTRPIDVIKVDVGDPAKLGVVVHTLYRKNVSGKTDSQNQAWSHIFTLYQAGQAKDALLEVRAYMLKFGADLPTKRMQQVCQMYPEVPSRHIYNFIDAAEC